MNNKSLTEKPESIPVSKLFENSVYEIPIYQRNYAWKAEHIEQLINDINDTANNQKYYLGSLIVNKKDANTYEVIDGQQRLTTLYLLYKYLFPKTTQNVLKFEAREMANNTLKNISIDGDKESQVSEIVEGYEIIKNMFQHEKIDKQEFISKLNMISIIRVQVPENIDLNHYFEIMNTRGEQLELHEISKAKILSVLKDDKDKGAGAIIWDACAKMDTYIQMNVNPDKRKLIFGDDWNEFKPENFEDLADVLGTSSSISKKTLDDILTNAIDANYENNHVKSEENGRFEPIINFPNFILQVNKTVSNCDNLDDKQFIDNIKKHYQNDESAKLFLFNLFKYRFLFDKYIIKREYAKTYKEDGRWSLKQLKKYGDNKVDKPLYSSTFDDNINKQIMTLQSCFRITYTSPKVMNWINNMLKELNEETPEPENVLSILEKYGISEIKQAEYKTKTGFSTKRIVYSYLDYILYRDGFGKYLEPKKSDFYFQFRNSIEHFYPQNPVESEKWSDDELHDLGNLALITTSGNSKFSNISPEGKVKTYPSVIKQSLKLIIMSEMMQKNNVWTKEISKNHRYDMIGLLDKECNKNP